MGRRKLVTKVAEGAQKIIPYSIKTLYDEDADALNQSAQKLILALNKTATLNKLDRLKLTAAEAQCAALSGTQVSQPSNIFVLNKLCVSQGNWINPKYSQSSQYQSYINPKIKVAKTPIQVQKQESVSFPFIIAKTHRFKTIQVQFQNQKLETQTRKLDDFYAFAFQQAWDYSVGRHILDWRLHFGDISVQQDVRDQLAKTTSIIQQYSRQIKNTLQKFPEFTKIPQQISNQQISWLDSRGYSDLLSIESDYIARIHKHYRKEMLIFLQRLQHKLI